MSQSRVPPSGGQVVGSTHVYDAKLQAGRGAEFSASYQQAEREAGMEAAWAMGDDFRLPMGHADDALDTEGLVQASLDVAIPASNRGFQMLQRMGWSQGHGLGASENGMVDPIRGGMEAGLRLGIGKAEQESFYISADNVTRKKLEAEIQLEEDSARTARRLMGVERDAAIKLDVSEAKRVLYCDTCHKQYKNAMEMETHLSSYDHHHTKRLQEMRQATADRTRGERERKERKRADKEWAKLNAQAARASEKRDVTGAPESSTAPPPPPPPPPLDDEVGAPPLPPPDGGGGTGGSAQPPLSSPQGTGSLSAALAARSHHCSGWSKPHRLQEGGGWEAALQPPPSDKDGSRLTQTRAEGPRSGAAHTPSRIRSSAASDGSRREGGATFHHRHPLSSKATSGIKQGAGDPFALSSMGAKAERQDAQRGSSGRPGVKLEPQRRAAIGFGGAAKRAPLKSTVAAFQMDSDED